MSYALACPPLPRSPVNLTDGEWHMLTVSSQPTGASSGSSSSGSSSGGRGWRLYVDGVMAAQLPGGWVGCVCA